MKTKFITLTLLVFLCFSSFGVAFAQDTPSTGTIYLQTATFDPLEGDDSSTTQEGSVAVAAIDALPVRYSIVQSKTGICN